MEQAHHLRHLLLLIITVSILIFPFSFPRPASTGVGRMKSLRASSLQSALYAKAKSKPVKHNDATAWVRENSPLFLRSGRSGDDGEIRKTKGTGWSKRKSQTDEA